MEVLKCKFACRFFYTFLNGLMYLNSLLEASGRRTLCAVVMKKKNVNSEEVEQFQTEITFLWWIIRTISGIDKI